ncbi:MAG: SufS family cysteine desulfurase [Candidatus Latescibacteria bacterium]|nr:SufS family cysteine desulfurase [Candidatus Latescibacterota bacterium]
MDIEDIRKDFPILSRTINGKPLSYLDNGATTHKPRQVIDSIVSFYSRSYSNIHRGVHLLSREATDLHEDARETVREFINAESREEIVFTSGTTESINLLAYSFGERFVDEEDEIIITGMEHHANIVPWQRLCERKKAVLRVIPIDDKGNLMLERLPELITEKTRLISVTHVSNVLGVLNPVDKIIEIAHQNSIPVMLDAAQSVQHLPVDVRKLGCDFLAFSAHKMYGPTGIGVLYGREKYLESLPPFITGGGMIESVNLRKSEYEDPPLKFEAGTGHLAGAVGLAAAIDYINEIGIETIREHEEKLLGALEEELKAPGDVTIYAEGAPKHGAVSFNIEGIHHYDAGMILDRLGVAVRTGAHCAEPLMKHLDITGTIRASVGLYNSIDDIDRLLAGIRETCRMMKV